MFFVRVYIFSGRANFFHGNRFSKRDDDATRLIYDCDGYLAGIQATVRHRLKHKLATGYPLCVNVVFLKKRRTVRKCVVDSLSQTVNDSHQKYLCNLSLHFSSRVTTLET